MANGKVWFVGAGPGDAGLLTQKGALALAKADVIIYDALVSLEILCELPLSARRIYVGKRAGQHTMTQEEINRLIIKEAQQGNRVVRLKGGDPFVFGRGGEEVEALKKKQIPYEVVPGITSAIAVPAYTGIPVTHRDFSSSFHVITGHSRKGGDDRVDYTALARMDGTLVFLMGVGQLTTISERLIEAGMDADTPAAIIENGTTSLQRQLLSSIQDLPRAAIRQQFKAPAIILVGKVAKLMSELNWLESMPLFGKQCIVTRDKDGGRQFADLLREKGAHVIQLPMLEFRLKKGSQEAFAAALQDIATNCFAQNWIVLSSPHDVESFFAMLAESDQDLRKLGYRTHFAVVGRKTAQALKKYGIHADLVPGKAYAQDLAKELQLRIGVSSKVFVFKGNLGGSEVYHRMVDCGVPCEELIIYETRMGWETDLTDRIMEEAVKEHTYTMFTSASSVEGFVLSMGKEREFSAVKAVCIGRKTAEKASAHGMQILVAEQPSMENMVNLLETQ